MSKWIKYGMLACFTGAMICSATGCGSKTTDTDKKIETSKDAGVKQNTNMQDNRDWQGTICCDRSSTKKIKIYASN